MNELLICVFGLLSGFAFGAPQNSLYLAPSKVHGLGIYTADKIAAGSIISDDVYIPIDDAYKTLPYRGQQRFLSWLRYVWPARINKFYPSKNSGSTPEIPEYMLNRFEDFGFNDANSVKFFEPTKDDSGFYRVSAFAPGIASLVNHAPNPIANIGQKNRLHDTFVTLVALRDIPAGSELLLDYGKPFEAMLTQKFQNDLSGNIWERRDESVHAAVPTKLPREADKRRRLVDYYAPYHYGPKKALVENGTPTAPPPTSSATAEESAPERIKWLRNNGLAMDRVKLEKETPVAAKAIHAGDVVMPAPLLLLKRDDLKLFHVNEDAELTRNTLDLDTVVGHEGILNNCMGVPDSEVLLLPNAHLMHLVQHGKEPNVEIQWSPGANGEKWLKAHPIDALDHSGEIMAQYVALRDIQPGEELVMDFGRDWEEAKQVALSNGEEFRHEIGVPEGFFPYAWRNQQVVYEIDDSLLAPGQMELLRWKHNAEPVARNLYRVGLPKGFSQRIHEYANDHGFMERYRILLNHDVLESGDWDVHEFDNDEEWFEHRYMNMEWQFNMHYIAAWNEIARKSFLGALGGAGFDTVLQATGNKLGLQNMTCFHASFMGVSECDDSFTHADVYGAQEKGFNYIFPIEIVEGSKPELDVQTDDGNVVVGVNYQYDVALALGDWVYHKTRAIEYDEADNIRVVIATYCAQIDDANAKILAHIYDGEDPAPFMDQFDRPSRELHWDKHDKSVALRQPSLLATS